jgi:hypothetical protein
MQPIAQSREEAEAQVKANRQLFINTIRQLDALSLHYRVELRPDEMMELAEVMDSRHAVKINPAMVTAINEIMPVCKGEGQHLDGRQFHTFWFGREYSRVLYVEIIKTYHTKVNQLGWAAVKQAMAELGKRAFCDECEVVEDTSTVLKFRLWWD